MTTMMAHVPKRATQHGIFLSSSEAAVVSLKPGQKELQRTGFYTAEMHPLEETYLSQDQFNKSVYGKGVSERTQPLDYEDPQKPNSPARKAAEKERAALEAAQATGGSTAGAGETKGSDYGTAHWRSEYRQGFDGDRLGQMQYKRQHGPPFEVQNPPACVSQPYELSYYQHEFGTYGSNPRSKIGANDRTIPTLKTDLTRGTTKGTNHIPGYQGYIPTNTNNPKVKAIESGDTVRDTSKTNLVEIYHLNIPGYAGTVPDNAKNDKGPRQISTMTVTGKDYSGTAGMAF